MAMRPNVRFGLLGLAGLPYAFLLLGNGYTAPVQKQGAFKEVAMVFKAHCNSCHTGKQSAAGLDLSTVKGIQKGGLSGKLFISGKADSSLLMKRVMGHGGMPRMPMGFAPLTKEQLDTLKGWINSGAKVDSGGMTHWAYVKPVLRTPPVTKNKAWVKNPIDSFILARLEKGALQPSKPASKETLIRRVTLDLTGLPPTLAEIDAFLADKSPSAYEKVVDRLLASPHYGERQARVWLDLARYADTNGYEADYIRTAYKYRDWVIEAFNKNMRYDQFTIEQLAGDLLPQPNLNQLIATGFHRNTMLNLEGGVDPNESRYEMITDRVATTSTVWLGQTLQCARCHDHKYDPISQKDFFRVYAIFANTEFESRGDANFGQQKFYEKDIPAPSEDQLAMQEEIELRISRLDEKLKSETIAHQVEREGWLKKAKAAKPYEGIKAKAEATNGLVLTPQADGTLLASGPVANSVYTFKFTASSPIHAFRLAMTPDASLPQKGVGRGSSGNFLLSRITLRVNGKPISIVKPTADFVQQGYNLQGLSDSNPETGWAVWPDVARKHWLVFRPQTAIPDSATVEIELGNESKSYPDHSLGRFLLSTTSEPVEAFQALPDDVTTALSTSTPSAKEQQTLTTFFQKGSPALKPIWDDIEASKAELKALKESIPMAMVMTEKKGTPTLKTTLRPRGEFLQKGETVIAGIPAVFGKSDAKRVDRLTLAKWLVAKENPLTARVQINRMWEQYFGIGLVETSENFGTPGTPPTHPELLDWLAIKFMNSGWDMKAMHRLIVTSATYRQSSAATKALLDRDPENKLLARGPRFRMEAEMIRDNALAAAGMLNLKIGGPSVYPYQPDGIWNSPYSGERWMNSTGPDRYRRGLYTFWKRTAPYPTFVNFDAMSREVCTVRRIRTNTPLQALNLLNDPAFLEAAKGLAQRVMLKGVRPGPSGVDPESYLQTSTEADSEPGTPSHAIVTAFRLCTARYPNAAESERLTDLYQSLVAKYTQKPDEAKKLGKSPEQAAMVMLASVLLNLDETINKE